MKKKWVETYTIFRLIYNYELDKYEIAKINKDTYIPDTGEYLKDGKNDLIIFDAELAGIFNRYGADFLNYADGSIYTKLKEIGKILHRNITQEDIKATRDLFKLRCPKCRKLIENKGSLFGYVEINMMNIDGVIVCKDCLEREK